MEVVIGGLPVVVDVVVVEIVGETVGGEASSMDSDSSTTNDSSKLSFLSRVSTESEAGAAV